MGVTDSKDSCRDEMQQARRKVKLNNCVITDPYSAGQVQGFRPIRLAFRFEECLFFFFLGIDSLVSFFLSSVPTRSP